MVEASAVGSSAGPRLTVECDGDKDETTEGAMDMLQAECGREDEYAPTTPLTATTKSVLPPMSKMARGTSRMASMSRHRRAVKDLPPMTAPYLGLVAPSESQLPRSHGGRRNPRGTWQAESRLRLSRDATCTSHR